MTPSQADMTAQDAANLDARGQAIAALNQLQAIADGFAQLPASHPRRAELLFAELYLNVTRSWIDKLAQRQDPDVVYRVVVNFLELYRDHVLTRPQGAVAAVAPHWQPYCRTIARQAEATPVTAQLWAVILGARAHTHGDLGIAIRAACAEQEQSGAPRDLSPEEMEHLFGRWTDEAFFHASQDFFRGWMTRETGRRRIVVGFYWSLVRHTRRFWLAVFQNWRTSGYREVCRRAMA